MQLNDAVAATAKGTVTNVADQGKVGLGRYIVVAHTSGITSTYGHLASFNVTIGQTVRQGATIGYADSTGNSSGNHLHWRVQLNGNAYKPEPASGYQGFGTWGACGNGQQSPSYVSKPPANNDYDGNGCADIMARISSNSQLWMYSGPCSTGYPVSSTQYSSNWSSLNRSFGAGAYSADGCVDVVARRASDSAMLLYPTVFTPVCASGFGSASSIATGWGTFSEIFSPRDFTGDGCSDVMARDSSGNLRLYYSPEVSGSCSGGALSYWGIVGTGWGTYDQILGPGDFSGDGCFDVIARRTSDYKLFMWEGNCNGSFKTGSAIQIGSGWGTYNLIVGPGDYDNDGCVDIVARSSTNNNLYLFRGDCASGWLNGGVPYVIGSGWGGFNMIF